MDENELIHTVEDFQSALDKVLRIDRQFVIKYIGETADNIEQNELGFARFRKPEDKVPIDVLCLRAIRDCLIKNPEAPLK